MRYSDKYCELLCNRFYARYNSTIKLKIRCVKCGKSYISVQASISQTEYSYLTRKYVCKECEKQECDKQE